MRKTIQLNVKNIAAMRRQPPTEYEVIRFDANNNCNVHCVYCHNTRSDDLIDPAEFQSFLEHNVISVDRFQLGCIMEPTMDPRMCDFMHIIASSPGKPRHVFRLQTNGILLHRHDHARMAEAGLSILAVSVDSADHSTHEDLRGGTSLAKVHRNLAAFHRACPSVSVKMLTTVTRANINDIDILIRWGIDLGVKAFELRQMFYHPSSKIVDHARMPLLLVTKKEFADLRERITLKFDKAATIGFYEADAIVQESQAVIAASLISPPSRDSVGVPPPVDSSLLG